MIFGDEKLFDGAPEDCCMVSFDEDENTFCFYMVVDCTVWFKFKINDKYEKLTNTKYPTNTISAMRRIIKEPKRWTWEDKKAGRLPEVGAELIHKTRGICEFIGVGLDEDACWALKQQSGSIYIADKSWCQPIETPAEKAARLKSEWCAKAAKQLKNLEYTSTLTSIYDAMLSGELKAPEGE